MSFPNIFIAGSSGSGKSTSLRNLDPENTIIISTERKALPFREAKTFTKQVMVKSYPQFLQVVAKAYMSSAEVIVIDSFTSLSEQILSYAQSQWKGFDVWSNYARLIYELVQASKDINKYIVFIGIDDPLQDSDGSITRHVKVEGNKMRGSIEKEFVCVFFTQVVVENNAKRYCFETNNFGKNTSKSPMDMFSERYIGNDLNEILTTIKEYYK